MAHIDAGKTTTTERISLRNVGNLHGNDGFQSDHWWTYLGTLGGRLWSFGEKVLPQEVVHLVKNDWLIPEWYVSFILMFSSELHLYTKLCTRKLQILILIRHCKILIIDIYIYISINIKIYINGGWDLNGGKQQEHAKMPQEWELPSLIPGFESYGLEEAHGIPWVFVVFCSICCSTRHVFSSNHLSLVSDWWFSHFVSSRYRCSHSHWFSFCEGFVTYIICDDVLKRHTIQWYIDYFRDAYMNLMK